MEVKEKQNAVTKDDGIKLCDVIIAGKTYKRNELDCVFSKAVLRLADKPTLIELWHAAIESQVKEYITKVDNVFNERFPRYE